jgi:hypothetical protein
MNLSDVQKLLVTADPFTAVRRSFQGWKKKQRVSRGRHLTVKQREEISGDLKDAAIGPVSMRADSSDREAVCYLGEIENVLKDAGFEVEVDNAKRKPLENQIPTGLEMTVKDATVRPIHAYRIVAAFRHAGVVIATRINKRRKQNNTLYVNVGSNEAPVVGPPVIPTGTAWQSKVWATVLNKWKKKFAQGL